jgi:tRNA (guanine37-N1)-methyltransferase
MKFNILTIFPEMFDGPFDASMLKSAAESGVIEISLVDIRDFATDKHRTVDDYPFGGGSGMIMKCEPVSLALEAVLAGRQRSEVNTVLLSPQGRVFSQNIARELAEKKEIALICGHYKGVDERIRDHLVDDEISIGDYVMTGGELAAMVVVDAVTRLLPGVLGDLASAETDSFYGGLIEGGNYTRPRTFEGHDVPEVLVGGNHEAIRQWQRRDSLRKTLERRPDLLEKAELTDEDKRMLEEIEKNRHIS